MAVHGNAAPVTTRSATPQSSRPNSISGAEVSARDADRRLPERTWTNGGEGRQWVGTGYNALIRALTDSNLDKESRLATRENLAAEAGFTLTGNVPRGMTTMFPVRVKTS